MPGRILRVAGRVDERLPQRIRLGVRVAIGVCQRDRGRGPPGDLGGHAAVVRLALQIVIAVSAIATFSSANSRLLRDIDR